MTVASPHAVAASATAAVMRTARIARDGGWRDIGSLRWPVGSRAGPAHATRSRVALAGEIPVRQAHRQATPMQRGAAAMLARGEVAEWLKAAVLKTVGRKPRGFESHPLRQLRGAVGGNRSSFGRALWLRGPVVSQSRTAPRRLLSIPSSITQHDE